MWMWLWVWEAVLPKLLMKKRQMSMRDKKVVKLMGAEGGMMVEEDLEEDQDT